MNQSDEPPIMAAQVIGPPCPNCGDPINTEEVCWLFNGKFYCSEKCAAKVARG